MPGMAGRAGCDSWPTALTRTSTDSVDPSANVTVQSVESASHLVPAQWEPNPDYEPGFCVPMVKIVIGMLSLTSARVTPSVA